MSAIHPTQFKPKRTPQMIAHEILTCIVTHVPNEKDPRTFANELNDIVAGLEVDEATRLSVALPTTSKEETDPLFAVNAQLPNYEKLLRALEEIDKGKKPSNAHIAVLQLAPELIVLHAKSLDAISKATLLTEDEFGELVDKTDPLNKDPVVSDAIIKNIRLYQDPGAKDQHQSKEAALQQSIRIASQTIREKIIPLFVELNEAIKHEHSIEESRGSA